MSLAEELTQELKSGVLLDHLRLCGTIPEHYAYDSTEEKLYAKYTDVLLATALGNIGLESRVITERSDAADVEAIGPKYGLVGDTKAFRLSRTARNPKDFKVDAVREWKFPHNYGMVVGPSYQLPKQRSQLYRQAITHEILVCSYQHICLLVVFGEFAGSERAQELLEIMLKAPGKMNPDKDAISYWNNLTRSIDAFDSNLRSMWERETKYMLEAVSLAKQEALQVLLQERRAIQELDRDAAIVELAKYRNLDGREKTIRTINPT